MRMRKPVVLLYCGGMGGDGGNGGGRLPSGFHWSGEEGGSGVSEEMGCGALVCARGLAEVPRRHFSDQINELSVAGEAAVSSDLPPSSKRVGDVYPGERERVGIRGVGGLCEGCRVKDVACTAW